MSRLTNDSNPACPLLLATLRHHRPLAVREEAVVDVERAAPGRTLSAHEGSGDRLLAALWNPYNSSETVKQAKALLMKMVELNVDSFIRMQLHQHEGGSS